MEAWKCGVKNCDCAMSIECTAESFERIGDVWTYLLKLFQRIGKM